MTMLNFHRFSTTKSCKKFSQIDIFSQSSEEFSSVVTVFLFSSQDLKKNCPKSKKKLFSQPSSGLFAVDKM
jgi:hypothetical protein